MKSKRPRSVAGARNINPMFVRIRMFSYPITDRLPRGGTLNCARYWRTLQEAFQTSANVHAIDVSFRHNWSCQLTAVGMQEYVLACIQLAPVR
jgi:hypothetical protein